MGRAGQPLYSCASASFTVQTTFVERVSATGVSCDDSRDVSARAFYSDWDLSFYSIENLMIEKCNEFSVTAGEHVPSTPIPNSGERSGEGRTLYVVRFTQMEFV